MGTTTKLLLLVQLVTIMVSTQSWIPPSALISVENQSIKSPTTARTKSSSVCSAVAVVDETTAATTTMATTTTMETTTTTREWSLQTSPMPIKSTVYTTVAVAGATGRTGRYVVQGLIQQGVPKVVALVRNEQKAMELFESEYKNDEKSQVEIVVCDFGNPTEIQRVFDENKVDAAIWCATGFVNVSSTTTKQFAPIKNKPHNISIPDPTPSLWNRFQAWLGIGSSDETNGNDSDVSDTPLRSLNQQDVDSIDDVALTAMVDALAARLNDIEPVDGTNPTIEHESPRLVMCSSAAVTRPTWDDTKRAQFVGAADIPIVRLNPFAILDVKRKSERALREACYRVNNERDSSIVSRKLQYCIVRPSGLNDKAPIGCRTLLSQGDVAVGRIHRQDVASLLIQVLSMPEAAGKTMEAVGVPGYPPGNQKALAVTLSRLYCDNEGTANLDVSPSFDSYTPDFNQIMATYQLMQQLLPGESQNSAALAMGQTYEQLDQGQMGRLGKRGEEDAQSAFVESQLVAQ